MTTRRALMLGSLSTLAGSGLSFPLNAIAAAASAAGPWAPRGTLKAFENERAFTAALERWHASSRELNRRLSRRQSGGAADALESQPPPAALAMAPNAAPAPSGVAQKAAENKADGESITNVQTAGVDEGGIVKHAGDFLIILRRGRLFTVRVGDDSLEPVASVDAYGPGIDPQGDWYDELLVSGSTVVVIGYSYARGGTEIGLFELDTADGSLGHRSTHHLRSFDYYSSRNYASRLIGRKLVFYTPSYISPWDDRPWDKLPGLRRWRGRTSAPFKRILPADRIYRTDDEFPPGEMLALHTVTQCDLDAPDLDCQSTAVLGPAGRVFYVSQGSVYVWTSAWSRRLPHAVPSDGSGPGSPRGEPQNLSAVFRIPLDGGAPSMLKTSGVPIDQMSFLEDERGHLNVLVRESGQGEGMWGSERTRGSMALLRVPLREFDDGSAAARKEHYRAVPAPRGYAVQNRFIGDWLLWGGETPRPEEGGRAAANGWALRFAANDPPQPLLPGHAIERIEALGRDAVLVGNAGADLHFTSVDLDRQGVRTRGRYVQERAAQGETRTHGFFYRPTGGDEGLLGLPILSGPRRRRPGGGIYAGEQGSASVLYLRQRDLRFTALGELEAAGRAQRDDACKASCVDWYGNARPIFLGRRVFALLGYELVEGTLEGDGGSERIEELRRVNFTPRVRRPRDNGRPWPFD